MAYGISVVLGGAQNPTGYGSKQPNIISCVSVVPLLSACCVAKEER